MKHAVLTAVKDAGPNACPPMVVGVGIGGTFEKCALMAKEALTGKWEVILRSHMSESWRKNCFQRSIPLGSVREDLEVQQPLWQ